MKPKKGDKISFRKVTGTVSSFYRNPDGTYTLNIQGKEYSDSFTRLEEKELDKIRVIA